MLGEQQHLPQRAPAQGAASTKFTLQKRPPQFLQLPLPRELLPAQPGLIQPRGRISLCFSGQWDRAALAGNLSIAQAEIRAQNHPLSTNGHSRALREPVLLQGCWMCPLCLCVFSDRIREPRTGLGWEGPRNSSHSTPGCSKPHPNRL